MPLNIDATFQNVNALKLDQFLGVDQKALKNSTIEVGGKSFNVRFAADGKVSVSFATTSFFHLFQGSAKTAVRNKLQELVDLNKLKTDLTQVSMRMGHNENLGLAIKDEILPTLNGQARDIAHYGFSAVREDAQNEMIRANNQEVKAGRTGINPMLVNDLNATVGLAGESNANDMIAFTIINKTGLIDRDYKTCGSIDHELSVAWGKYLQGRDVDMFSKINLAIDEAAGGKTTGWAGEINKHGLEDTVVQMVKKNLDPRLFSKVADINELLLPVARAIIEAKDADFSNLEGSNVRGDKYVDKITNKLKEILAKYVGGDDTAKLERAYKVFNTAFTSAFWRQTSKLGLDFFKERGTPVVFEWTKYNGEEVGDEVNDKWWKDSNSDVYKHFGAAITNSEMRHIQGDKYAAKVGDNKMIYVQGRNTEAQIKANIDASVESLSQLPADELKGVYESLMRNFRSMNANNFAPSCIKVIQTLPDFSIIDFVSTDGELLHDGEIAIENAVNRVIDKINNSKSMLVKTAILMNMGQAVEAELLRNETIVEHLESYATVSADSSISKEAALARTLHSVENGKGHEIFFDKSGKPNDLGKFVLTKAAKDNVSVETLVNTLKEELSARLGIPDALSNPVVKPFLMRAAGGTYSFDSFLDKSLDSIKNAYEAKVALAADVAEMLQKKSPAVKAIYNRRGDWDMNRLISKASGHAVNDDTLKPLRRNAEMIISICERAEDFATKMEAALQVEFTPEERNRLIDSYLDRPTSAACNYRLDGSTSTAAKLDDDGAKCINRYRAIAQEIAQKGEILTPAERKSILIEAVSDNAKSFHVNAAISLVTAAKANPPAAMAGRTPEDVKAFLENLAEKMKAAWQAEILNYKSTHDSVVDALGPDDWNGMGAMALAAYLVNDAETSKLLESAMKDEKVREMIEDLAYSPEIADESSPVKALAAAATRYNQMT